MEGKEGDDTFDEMTEKICAQMEAMDQKEYVLEMNDDIGRSHRWRTNSKVNGDLKIMNLVNGCYMYEIGSIMWWLVYMRYDMETEELTTHDYYEMQWFMDPSTSCILSKNCVTLLPRDKDDYKQFLQDKGVTKRWVYFKPDMFIREKYGKDVDAKVEIIMNTNGVERDELIRKIQSNPRFDRKKGLKDEKSIRLQICLMDGHPFHSKPKYGTDYFALCILHMLVTGEGKWAARVPFMLLEGMHACYM